MNKILQVYLNQQHVGELKQNRHGQMLFTYTSEWLQNPSAFAISCSLPLRPETFTQKECRPFFAGVLPEDATRKLIARNLGISASNDFSMLEKIGGECAGAITFIQQNENLDTTNNQYKELNEKSLTQLLETLTYQPLLAGEDNVRLSMAGVQDKLPVHINNNKKISIPLNNSPSTHILKPINPRFNGLLYNEAFCMSLAKKSGLITASTEIREVSGIKYLLIERYDRIITDQHIERLHQEDFCQATGIVPEKKYQNEGGPSFKSCFELLRKVSSVPVVDLNRMIEAIIFNFLIGNCDAHGKNFSLLYKDGITLSPLYDLVCTVYYKNLTNKMAMKIGKEYDLRKIRLTQFNAFAEQIGFSKPGIQSSITKTTKTILSALKQMPIMNDIESDIYKIIEYRCQSLLTEKTK